MGKPGPPKIDTLIHAPVRLAIVSTLVSVEEAEFGYLKDVTGASDGNLSTHLSRLEEGGMVSIEKTFRGRKPLTICRLTDRGRRAFKSYLTDLEKILKQDPTKT